MHVTIPDAVLAQIVQHRPHLATIAANVQAGVVPERALAVASGALADHIAQRFADWGLTAAESDVALFALKGCDAAEIAALRGAAQGTVRAQLSQVYAKARVTSQAGLVSLFLEDLL